MSLPSFMVERSRSRGLAPGSGSRFGTEPRSRSIGLTSSRGSTSGTLIRQFWRALKAAPLTRNEVSGGLPSLSSPATQIFRASMVFLLQQQPLFSTRAAAYRTHSLVSALRALTRALVASFQRLQSTVPKYSTAATRALASASLALILAAVAAAPPGAALSSAAICCGVGAGGQSGGINPPDTAPIGPVTRLFAIWPSCVLQSLAIHACTFAPDRPKKPQIVCGAAAAGVAAPPPAAPSPEAAAVDAPPGTAAAPASWARVCGEDARARTKSPATHVFGDDINRSPWTAL